LLTNIYTLRIKEKKIMSFVEIKGIKKHFGQGDSLVNVLNGVDISIEKGEICVLLGPSGSGKSTLLNIIGGIENADEGYIAIDGEKTKDMNEKQLTLYRRKHLGYVFQMYNLIPNLTVRENIEVGKYLGSDTLDVDVLVKTLGIYEKTLSAIFLIASLCVTIIIVLPYFLFMSSISFRISFEVL